MEEYTKISNAIDLRGGKKKGIMGRIRKFRLILEPLLISALRRSTELGNSIQLRAFGSCKRTHYNDISMKKSDWIITVTIIATVALLTYMRFFLGIFSGMGVTYLLPS